MAVVGHGADQRHRAAVDLQGKDAAVVLQQHAAARHGLASQRGGRGGVEFPRHGIGPVQQSLRDLDAQNATHRLVERRRGNFPGLEQRRQARAVAVADHFHVDTGGESHGGGLGLVGGVTVLDQFIDRVPVAHHEALEAPLFAQHLGERETVAGGGHTVETVESAHQRGDTGVDAGLERRQVDITQRGQADLGGVVVAAAFGRAVTHVVLQAGGDAVLLRVTGSLKSAHGGSRHPAAEPRILAGPLGDASPARVAGDVHHRREHPVDAGGGRLGGGHGFDALDELLIPRAGQPEWNRKDRAEAVDRVETEDQRNAQARFLDGQALQPVAQSGIGSCAEKGADATGCDQGGVGFIGPGFHLLLP